MEAALRLDGVTKNYGKVVAVRDLRLEVRRGEVFGFLGPNGAGKTTTLRLLLDLIRPTTGRIEVLGLDPRRDGVRLRRRIGYVSGEDALYERWTGHQHLELIAGLREGLPAGSAAALARRLASRLDVRVDDLSHGNRQKVALVAALAAMPDMLLLDEPTQGLDPLAREAVHDLVREARRRGITVFLSSHDLHEVEEVCDRVALIREGRLAAVAGLLLSVLTPDLSAQSSADPRIRIGFGVAGLAVLRLSALLLELLPDGIELVFDHGRWNFEVVRLAEFVEQLAFQAQAGDFLVFAALFFAKLNRALQRR